MCGIVAILSETAPIPPERLNHAVRALRHRGPDGQGQWFSADGRVGLGHRRLSIIDLMTGAQPLANEDGQLQLVVNGEFYGFAHIRQTLEAKGHRFRTRADSEIALHLYEDYGLRFVEHLRGEFALILWDAAQRRLIAARDRFGIKPLFYAHHRKTLYLASEAKALFAIGVPAGWDEEAAFQQLFLCLPQDRSLFNGIRQVPAGHLLIYQDSVHQLKCYWDVQYPPHEIRRNQYAREECIAHTRAQLTEAIRLRLQADVPVGVLLSGGLDSSSVLGFASALSSKPLTAFTIAFPDADYDESTQARRTADYLKADFRPVLVTEAEVADHFSDSVWYGETLQYNAHGTARYLLSRAIHNAGFKVVMAGEGADELFAGYGFCRAALFKRTGGRFLPRWLRLLFRLLRPATSSEKWVAQTSPWLAGVLKGLGVPATLVTALADQLGLLRSVLADDFLARFCHQDPYRTFFHSINATTKLRGREPVKQILYLWLKSLFVSYNLAVDRVDMAHAVEVRLPFLDHLVFEYGSQLPGSVLASADQEKALLREAARPFIPDWVYRQPKKPFFAPPTVLQAGHRMYELLQDLLRSPILLATPFFNAQAVHALLDHLPTQPLAERAAFDPLLLLIASLCVLQERYHL